MMEGKMPLIGEKFPEMEVVTNLGNIKLPDDFKGKWFVLFSHPGDFTPVCTTEFFSFAKHHDDFKKLNTELIGLSVDSKISHIEWINWIKQNLKIDIKFPIIADPMGHVATKLGMIQAQSATQTVRAVFIVDDRSTIRAILYYPMETGRNISEILRLIKSLQMVDKYKIVTPANWPNNEIIGDNVLNPPPATQNDIEERTKKYKGYAWWLTYQDANKADVDEAKEITGE
ncbi:peroxiredoxin [Picrophilus oshimae]